MLSGNVDISDVQKTLMKVYRNTGNLKSLYEMFGPQMQKSMQKTFDVEGRPDKWARLAESTIRQRTKGPKGRSPKKLQDTGDLVNSLTYKASRNELRWGVGASVNYGIYHEHGTRKMPARKFIAQKDGKVMFKEDIKAFFRRIEDYLTLVFKKARFGL